MEYISSFAKYFDAIFPPFTGNRRNARQAKLND